MAFRNIEDLERWLRITGMGARHAGILESARKTLLFLREAVLDDPLPIGAHKYGGFPDLPLSFSWPERPAYPDATSKAHEIRRLMEGHRTSWLDRFGEIKNEAMRRIAKDYVDDLEEDCDGRCGVLFEPLPLAFVAQFNLTALACTDGLDPDLPDHGLLSIFADMSWEGHAGHHWIFWHDVSIEGLKRKTPPNRLVEHFDDYGRVAQDKLWAKKSSAESLDPVSAVSIPDHWWSVALPSEEQMDACNSPEARQCVFRPKSRNASGSIADFSDRLGGWPETLQNQHPEDDLEWSYMHQMLSPGQTQWRHVFGGDHQFLGYDTRFMHARLGHGDRIHIMAKAADLLRLRFDKTKTSVSYE